MSQVPNTIHGLSPHECISAIQKGIRRNQERIAMDFAVEMTQTSKGFCSWVCNRLRIISHEDIDNMTQPEIVPFVHTCTEQAKEMYKDGDPGPSLMAIGNAIRIMARAQKSREGDNFQITTRLNNILNGPPEVPDCALDKHTRRGKAMGRGFTFFVEEGTKLSPDSGNDRYKEEGEAWLLECEKKYGGKFPDAGKQYNGRSQQSNLF